MMKRLLPILLLLTACSSQQVQQGVTLPRDARWALLPLINLSEAPRAGERARRLVEAALRARGVEPVLAPTPRAPEALPLLDDRVRLDKALAWARRERIRYAVTGSVEEWRYKSGLDGEPAVGLSLRIVEIPEGRVVWVGAGARTGWGYANLSGTATRVIDDLLDTLQLASDTPAH